MGFHFRDDLTSADYAFDADGETLEELFRASADALLSLMIAHAASLGSDVRHEIVLHAQGPKEAAAESLLHALLEKLVFFKDAEGVFLRLRDVRILEPPEGGGLTLHATLSGEPIEPMTQELGTDVKGVTMHRFEVKKTPNGWRATVVLDT